MASHERGAGGDVPSLTAVYVDFQDAACYRVWRWLAHLTVAVEVRPFSLDSVDGQRSSPWEVACPTWALELLALGECAREGGASVHRRFVDAAFALVHEGTADPSEPEAWLRLGTELGVDLERFTGEGDRWRAEVGLWHREAADELGVAGVPTLVFDEGRALRLVLAEEVQGPAAARRLLDDLADLVGQPVAEIHRLR